MLRAAMPNDAKRLSVGAAFALLMVGLAIIGAFRGYSPVPYMDMWDAYVNFFMQVQDGGGVHPWWAPHNEHRLVLTRLFCWADLAWFDGAVWPMLVAIYLFVFGGAFVFWRMLREFAGTARAGTNELTLGLVITGCLFLWVQYENLTFAVQIQCVLAQLLPLCALYSLHKSVVAPHPDRHFLLACAFGLASVGTMANGTLTLPLMTLYATLTRQGAVRIGALAALSLTTVLLYFHDYRAPAHHGDLLAALTENPAAFVEYVLLYLGSPFYYLFGGSIGRLIPALGAAGSVAHWLAKLMTMAAGLFLIALSARLAVRTLQRPRESTLALALLVFILYIGGTAFGTAGGRLLFGVDQALSSRYTTPAIMAWCALLVLYTPNVLAAMGTNDTRRLFPGALLMLLMSLLQFFALKSHDAKLFERRIAALALELQVRDQEQVAIVYPDLQRALAIAEKASARKISVFGMYPYRDAREHLGVSVLQAALPPCRGRLDAATAIEGDARFVRVSGWMFDPAAERYPEVVRFLDPERRIAGYALTGPVRTDIADATGRKTETAGYTGYLLATPPGSVLTLQGVRPSCELQVRVPAAS